MHFKKRNLIADSNIGIQRHKAFNCTRLEPLSHSTITLLGELKLKEAKNKHWEHMQSKNINLRSIFYFVFQLSD